MSTAAHPLVGRAIRHIGAGQAATAVAAVSAVATGAAVLLHVRSDARSVVELRRRGASWCSWSPTIVFHPKRHR